LHAASKTLRKQRAAAQRVKQGTQRWHRLAATAARCRHLRCVLTHRLQRIR
jgi:hypothetical protein